MELTFEHKIKSVVEESIAEELGIEPGDTLISINDQPVKDILDYYFLVEDEYLEVLIRKPDGEEWLLEIEKDEPEDLGLEFNDKLMGQYKSCSNKCIFCFIDQLPKEMRQTLYFKDDDSRLSFLKGNYITLTNMKEADIERIIEYKLSPINISVHTTDMELRRKMLKNKFAGDLMSHLKKLADAGIQMNGQIVLCKGVNDGLQLDKTIEDLSMFIPYMQSVSIVPVGITRFRDGLFELKPFDKEDAVKIIKQVEEHQKKIFEKHGIHFIHVSDEFYILGEALMPNEENYDGYLQFENGVGMMRLLIDEFKQALDQKCENEAINKVVTIATGKLASNYISMLIKEMNAKYPNIKVNVVAIENEFFGPYITVSGLLTGKDIINQLKGKNLGEKLLLPNNILKADTDILLDDLTLKDIENALQIKVHVVESSGSDLLEAIID